MPTYIKSFKYGRKDWLYWWCSEEYTKFVKKFKLSTDIPFDYSIDLKGDEAQSLYSYALRSKVELVITGTRLKSPLANINMNSRNSQGERR
ncbi:MAG: hypothetical protein ACLFNU_12050 [Bacteroidales bacterium]